MNLRFADASVHGEHDLAARRHGQAIGMIELVAGDVQVAVCAVRLHAFEAEEAVFAARDDVRDLGGADLDHAAVRRDDEHRRARPRVRADAIIPALHLVAREFGVRAVFVQMAFAGQMQDHAAERVQRAITPTPRAPGTTALPK